MPQHIFNRKTLKRKLDQFDLTAIPDLEGKRQRIDNWITSLQKGTVQSSKEEALQGKFLEDIFCHVLGYAGKIDSPDQWQLEHEKKTLKDGTKADGALGYFTVEKGEDIRVVIELKSMKQALDQKQNRKDYSGTPLDQAFTYISKSGEKCRWAIVSNYNDIWLLHRNKGVTHCEKFQLGKLGNETEFKRFYFLLAKSQLMEKRKKSVVDQLLEQNQKDEESISKKFYTEFKAVRLQLFEHLKENNPQVEEVLLFTKTQKLLDRFIFVCFCEDTGLLPERIFRKAIKAAQESFDPGDGKVWRQITGLFRSIDQGHPDRGINQFNGGLFADDPQLDGLTIKDEIFEPLAKITDYDFESDVNVDILGHIFEQSITDIEEIKAGIRGEAVEPKKGKRKKDGIFYTPAYITQYMVEQTVGGWLNERKQELGIENLPELTEKDLKSVKTTKKGISGSKPLLRHIAFWEAYREKLAVIKVIDPACGSGAFLNQVFDYLYREGQMVNETLSELQGGQTMILDLQKHILENNIYGVDLNAESVEITRLSLWLKTANKEKPLTALDQNIRCGNSLIDDPEVAGESAFDWKKGFPEIMRSGGFDVVIGNPPYVRQENLGEQKLFFEKNYQSYAGTADLFTYFYEKGLNLLKKGGYFSFISNTFFKTAAGESLRRYLKNNSRFVSLTDFSDIQVFADATTYPIIPVLKKENPSGGLNYFKVDPEDLTALDTAQKEKMFSVKQSSLKDEYWTFESETEQELKEKIREFPSVKEQFGKCYRGIVTGMIGAFIITKEQRQNILNHYPAESEMIKPLFEGKDLKKWSAPEIDKWLIFTRRGIDIEKYPGVKAYLEQFREDLTPKTDKTQKRGRKPGKYQWYEVQDSVEYYPLFDSPKLIWPNLQSANKFAYDEEGYYLTNPSVILPSDSKALLGILNSKLAWYFFKDICVIRSGGFVEMQAQYVEKFPVTLPEDETLFIEKVDIVINATKALQKCQADLLKLITRELKPIKVSKKLENWIDLDWDGFKAELSKGKVKVKDFSVKERKEWMNSFDEEKEKAEAFKFTIRQTEAEIDQLVYHLYGLTDEEIKIVEGS